MTVFKSRHCGTENRQNWTESHSTLLWKYWTKSTSYRQDRCWLEFAWHQELDSHWRVTRDIYNKVYTGRNNRSEPQGKKRNTKKPSLLPSNQQISLEWNRHSLPHCWRSRSLMTLTHFPIQPLCTCIGPLRTNIYQQTVGLCKERKNINSEQVCYTHTILQGGSKTYVGLGCDLGEVGHRLLGLQPLTLIAVEAA